MKNAIVLLAIAGLLSACSYKVPNTFLLPANLASNMKYMPKPYATDSARSKIYIQGHYQAFDGSTADEYATTEAFEVSLSRGHQLKDIQFAYGASLTTGNASYNIYDKDGDVLNSAKKGFGSLLLQASINGVKRFGSTEFRFLSLDLGYSKEFGEYPKSRQALEGNRYYTTLSNTSFGTVGLGSELCLSGGLIGFAFKLGVAKNIGNFLYVENSNAYLKNTVFPYIAIQTSCKGFIGTFEGSDNTLRIGLGFGF